MSLKLNDKLQYFNHIKAEDNRNHDLAIPQPTKIDPIRIRRKKSSRQKEKLRVLPNILNPYIKNC